MQEEIHKRWVVGKDVINMRLRLRLSEDPCITFKWNAVVLATCTCTKSSQNKHLFRNRRIALEFVVLVSSISSTKPVTGGQLRYKRNNEN